LDLAAASFSGVEPKVTGRPGYAPADLLNRVRSSRRLEVETHRNIEVIWLLRHLKPDFKTIADFRRDNRNSFRQVFREFCAALSPTGPVWPRVAGGGWHADQGGQQQGSPAGQCSPTWNEVEPVRAPTKQIIPAASAIKSERYRKRSSIFPLRYIQMPRLVP
jgi:hypothetical protein